MPQTCTTKLNDVISNIIITDYGLKYIDARMQAATAKEFEDATLVNIPQLIELLKNKYLSKIIRSYGTDTMSGEYHKKINDDRIYAVAHGHHPFQSANRLSLGWEKRIANGFMPITQGEAKLLFMDAIPIADVRKGYDASNQTTAINLDKDKPIITPSGEMMGYDAWMIDDRILAACGSEENRTGLGQFLFKSEKKRQEIRNTHCINDMPFDNPVGRLLWLPGNSGIHGSCGTPDSYGRFIGTNTPAYLLKNTLKKD
jgi:hypothetical protein